jgi:hypothetical protein
MQAAATDFRILGTAGFHPAILAPAHRLGRDKRRRVLVRTTLGSVGNHRRRLDLDPAASSIKPATCTAVMAGKLRPITSRYTVPKLAIGRKVLALVEHVPGHADDVLRDGRRPRPGRRRCSPAPGAPEPTKSLVWKRHWLSQPICPPTAITRPRASMPLEYPLGGAHPGGCNTP